MKKLDYILKIIWMMALPMGIAIMLISSAIIGYVKLEDERAALLLNITCVYAVIYLTGWLINLIWSAIYSIYEHERLKRLDKFYEDHPEELKKHQEKIAQDFEDIAKAMRKDIKK